MKTITVNQLGTGVYLVKTDGSEGELSTEQIKALKKHLSEASHSPCKVASNSIHEYVSLLNGRTSSTQQVPMQEICKKFLHLSVRQMAEGEFAGAYHWSAKDGRIYVRVVDLTKLRGPQEQLQSLGQINSAQMSRELIRLGLVDVDGNGKPKRFERKAARYPMRVGHMVALKIEELTAYLG